MLEAYRQHANERKQLGVPPLPLSAEQTTALTHLLCAPPPPEKKRS